MNTEEKFYECFGIKPNKNLLPYGEILYTPKPISDGRLLRLICMVSEIYPITINCRETVEELKEFVLRFCIRHSKEVDSKQVQHIFKEYY